MKDKITIWIKKLNAISSSIRSEFGSLSGEDLNWKPGEDNWSIAQIIEHIITTNKTYFPIFSQLSEGTFKTPLLGKLPFMPSLLGNLILNSVKPETKRKMKTLAIWEPSRSFISGDIVVRFVSHQQQLIQKIESINSMFGKNIVIHSPPNKFIVYTLDKAIQILVYHEERHLIQAREVLSLKSS